MAQLAVRDDPLFEVDPREVLRDGPCWTVDTLLELRREAPARGLCLIVGEDSFASMGSWHQSEKVLTLANILVMRRDPPVPIPRQTSSDDFSPLRTAPCGHICYCPIEPQPISASLIRRAVSEGQPIDEWVPEEVRRYIATQHLYAVKGG